jgi:nicotinamidase-related amidase
VVTEYCVNYAAMGLLQRGHRVSIVQDAIETLDADAGRKAVDELQKLGAKVINTADALASV